jgi:A/G-specific adenine glycosylase
MNSLVLLNHKSKINKSLLGWYKHYARVLPWRKTHNPYRILISEVMLQQTQVSRVLQKYPEFLRRFPSMKALAAARPADVIRAWAGMGYNNRALRLQQLAQNVQTKCKGRLPSDPTALESLPGIGRYSANAIACFAFGKHVPVVDTNVRRVFSRMLGKQISIAEEWKCAEQMLPRSNVYHWNQGLMELGALVCSSANPQCPVCPLKFYCRSAGRIVSPTKRKPASSTKPKIPDRIYRGKIITVLRSLNGRSAMNSIQLLERVKPKIGKRKLAKLLGSLRRDGLLQIIAHNQIQYISLPT